ncbi:MAG: hypothetical protein EZS28_006954 [Streblomastix strix]|uniref:Uncharacterized protein n=1 Tax=Streblomastix strix TaxID=222440 RepID=A0A5J4WSY1_9EUKA|nr:MAG: hypothetical protein EZS28_006954 [Streblomastix strix]
MRGCFMCRIEMMVIMDINLDMQVNDCYESVGDYYYYCYYYIQYNYDGRSGSVFEGRVGGFGSCYTGPGESGSIVAIDEFNNGFDF